ncbi:MAG: sensor histidine kinase [Gemmatimonadaceae bacterium]
MTAAQPELGSERTTSLSQRPIQRERMKAAQDVAASLARELRNPVFAIASASQLLRYRVSDDPVIEKNIGRILREADRLNAYVTALLEYSAPTPLRLTPGDPDDVWSDVITHQRGDLESRAILAHHTPAEPRATCSLDAEQLARTFASALANAIEAAPEGSDIGVRSVATDDGLWVCVVHNDGPPIDDETLARAFEPLVTTKPGHAGIGLAVAQRIVVDHGGAVALRSDGAGATLTITLPLHG